MENRLELDLNLVRVIVMRLGFKLRLAAAPGPGGYAAIRGTGRGIMTAAAAAAARPPPALVTEYRGTGLTLSLRNRAVTVAGGQRLTRLTPGRPSWCGLRRLIHATTELS